MFEEYYCTTKWQGGTKLFLFTVQANAPKSCGKSKLRKQFNFLSSDLHQWIDFFCGYAPKKYKPVYKVAAQL